MPRPSVRRVARFADLIAPAAPVSNFLSGETIHEKETEVG